MWDGRTEPKYDISIIYEMRHKGNHVPEDGPSEGGTIEVAYDNRKITPEEIESLLTGVGLRIKRADPFFFTPSKRIYRAIVLFEISLAVLLALIIYKVLI